jgi:hypothetical protein
VPPQGWGSGAENEAKAAAEQSYRDATGDFDTDPFDPREFGARRYANQPDEPPPDNVIPLPWAADPTIEHDWLQHGLGDYEDWHPGPHIIEGAFDATGGQQFPGLNQMQPTGESTGSTHEGTEIHQQPSGERWLIKHTPSYGPFMAAGDVAANAIQAASGLKTPPTFAINSTPQGGYDEVPASAQVMFPDSKNAFSSKKPDPEKLSDADLMTLQKHHALDWLIGNHDSHGNQFIRTPDGELVGIDKGQAFKHYAQDRLHWNYHPNGVYGETEPVYNGLYRNMAQGGRILNDPRQGELGQYIQGLQDLDDAEFADTIRPYAEQAAAAGGLSRYHKQYNKHADARLEPNDVEGFLNYAVQRKNSLMNDFGDLYDRAMAHRHMGEKIAAVGRLAMAMPNPKEMVPTGEFAGSHNDSQFYTDPQGQWLVKRPNHGNEFLAPLDAATAKLQQMVGLETPETYAMPFQGGVATAVKRYRGPNGEAKAPLRWSPDQFPKGHPPGLKHMTDDEQLTLQKHHALDWLIANHDAHVGNWLDTDHGLVGIDKGQALKYLGGDRLDYKFKPNYYAKDPIYNRMWQDHARGKGEMLDPREGELGQFVQSLQDIPDWKIRQLFSPYAHGAANAGMLGTGRYGTGSFYTQPPDPSRGLTKPPFKPNDPGAFLDYLVDRKNNLMKDLGDFYDKTSIEREQNLASGGAKAWKRKPKYQPYGGGSFPSFSSGGGYGGGGYKPHKPYKSKGYQSKQPWAQKPSTSSSGQPKKKKGQPPAWLPDEDWGF